jgi:hypothetical protein
VHSGNRYADNGYCKPGKRRFFRFRHDRKIRLMHLLLFSGKRKGHMDERTLEKAGTLFTVCHPVSAVPLYTEFAISR